MLSVPQRGEPPIQELSEQRTTLYVFQRGGTDSARIHAMPWRRSLSHIGRAERPLPTRTPLRRTKAGSDTLVYSQGLS